MRKWLFRLALIAVTLTILTVSYLPVSVQASPEFISISVNTKAIPDNRQPQLEPRSQAIIVTALGTAQSKTALSAITGLTVTPESSSQVIVVMASDTVTNAVVFAHGYGESASYGGSIYALTNDGTYVYAGGYLTNTVRKYLMSDMSYIGESASYGGQITALTNDGTYVYAGGSTTNTVRKYLMSDMSYIGESASYGGTIYALTNDGTYVYAGGSTNNTVRKYLMSNMSYIGESASYGDSIYALTNDGTYVYAGGYLTNTVRKYLVSNMSYIGESASYGGPIHALTNDGTYVYAGGYLTNTVRKYLVSNMSYIGESASYGGQIAALTNDGTYVYAGGFTTNTVRKYLFKTLASIVTATSAGNVITGIWSSTFTDVTLRGFSVAGTLGANAITAYHVTGLAASPFDKSATGTGTSASPATAATAALAQADELVIGGIGTEGPVEDTAGTWTTGASNVSGNEQRNGTTTGGAASNISVSSAAEVVSATTAQIAAKTGITSRDWAAAIATYKMANNLYDFTNAPSIKALGIVATSTTYWTNGSQPASPLADAGAYFTITSTGSAASDIDFHGHNATGGVGWTLTSNSPGSNEYRVKIYKEGDTVPSGGVYLTTSDQEIISNLASGANIDWELSLETGSSFGDGVAKSGIITLTARAVN